METLMVIAPEGKICSRENSRAVIDDKEPVQVPNNAFYRRLLAEGSLLYIAPEIQSKAAPQRAPKKTENPKGVKE